MAAQVDKPEPKMLSSAVGESAHNGNNGGSEDASSTQPSSIHEKDTTLEKTASFESSAAQHMHGHDEDVEKTAGRHGDGAADEAAATKASADPNLVDFDGPDDPIKAINWPQSRKWTTVAALSFMTLITPLASSMFAPGVPEVLTEFHSDNEILASFVVSVYVLGYAIGPLIIAPLSELYGRAILYHITNVLFIVFTIACAVSSTFNMLIGFRFLEGVAGSAVLTMGGGTIADLFRQEERGRAMALWSMGPLLGPVIGPVAGGFLATAAGWRWVFWLIAIAAGVVAIIFLIFLRESYAPVILHHKVKRLRKETGNPNLRAKTDTGESAGALFRKAIIRPLKMLILSPIVFLLSLYMAITYGYLYLLFTTLTSVFENDYGFGSGIVGLTFLGIGVGMFAGLFVVGAVSDRILKKKAAEAKAGGGTGELKPEYRLPPLIIAAFLVPIGLFIYGWTAQYHVFWFVPILGTALVGMGLILAFMAINTYLVDAFTLHAASVMAANTILRSLLGALLPLAGPAMYQALGLGWGNSLLAFIAVALIPVPFVFIKFGERLRTAKRFQVKL